MRAIEQSRIVSACVALAFLAAFSCQTTTPSLTALVQEESVLLNEFTATQGAINQARDAIGATRYEALLTQAALVQDAVRAIRTARDAGDVATMRVKLDTMRTELNKLRSQAVTAGIVVPAGGGA